MDCPETATVENGSIPAAHRILTVFIEQGKHLLKIFNCLIHYTLTHIYRKGFLQGRINGFMIQLV